MAEEENSNALDFTVFDLAERIARGMTLSRAAHREVARELLVWREIVIRFATTASTDLPASAFETMRELMKRAMHRTE